MATKYINISYPFKDSKKGFFLDLTSDDNEAIKSDLLHLILTRRGQRFYNPEFGTNLLQFIFEPNDELTLTSIKTEITEVVGKYLPQVKFDEITIEESEESEYAVVLTLQYTVTEGSFSINEIVTINI